MIKLKQLFLASAMAVAMGSMAQNPANYRPAVYPQQQTTVGSATLNVSSSADATEYLFTNAVLDAKFVKQGDKLTFGGSTAMDLLAGTELFTVKFGTGGTKVVKASEMTLTDVQVVDLPADTKAVKGAPHFAGKALQATFTYKYSTANVTITWTAELRDGSHYLKTGVQLSADKDVQMFAVIPMQYNVDVKASGVKAPVPVGDSRLRGRVISNDKIFACLDTPTGINTAGNEPGVAAEGEVVKTWTDAWEPTSWKTVPSGEVPYRIIEQDYNYPKVLYKDFQIEVTEKGAVNVEFHYGGVGNHGLNMCGVELISGGQTLGDYHHGFAGGKETLNTYSIDVNEPGTYTVRMYVENKTEEIDSKGSIKLTLVRRAEETGAAGEVVPMQGVWSRNTKLTVGTTWSVGSVVGLMAPEEGRRSVLAYLERERAVPWRPYPIYNSWYELNINRTNKNVNPDNNLQVEQTVDVLKQWKKHMFDTQGVSIKAFVWDDGWDKYGTWEFHNGFPNGFMEPDIVARQMCSGQGAWLGPCGGYDTAGTERKNYWKRQGLECNLYNKKYYDVFVNACRNLCNSYDFRYFKFDGISALPTAYGPDMGATNGEEDAEGIISVENDVRYNIKPDIFFNTTVGTWASPLWLNISDAVWRQDRDHWTLGNNSNSREKWITYRDDLVYQHFVAENPLMTINSMMTHGFILTQYGESYTVGMPRDYKSVLNELRCAFACGSGQVELYCDYELMNTIQKDTNDPSTAGALWKDMADLIKWQRANADVLPDIHWVGNDPYTTKENVYGWAAWNGNKAVLSLRNGSSSSQTYKFTLREALNIPSSVSTTITLQKPFDDQKALTGLTEGTAIDIDEEISVTLPGSSVYMFNGLDGNGSLVLVSDLHFEQSEVHVPAGRAKAPAYVVAPLDASDKTLEWTSDDESIATVNDGAITGVAPGETTVTAKTVDGSGLTMKIKVIVDVNLQNDLDKLIEEAQNTYDFYESVEYGGNLITAVSQFSSPFSDSQEGTSFPLLDGNGSTFWHSDWHAGDKTPHSHYLQVTLPEVVQGTVQATVMRRLNNGSLLADDNPVLMGVEVSADGKNYTSVGQMDLPYGDKVVYGTFECTDPARFFRFWNDKSNNKDRGYWHVGDFQLNCVVRESLNSEHRAEADALLAALAEARKVTDATQPDIDALEAAYKAYLEAVDPSVVHVTQVINDTLEGKATLGDVNASVRRVLRITDLLGRRTNGNAGGVQIEGTRKVIR